jgi:hypothetical protein
MNKEKLNNRSTQSCCRISDSESGKEIECDSNCRRKAIFGLSGIGTIFITAFGSVYLIELSALRITWLVLMGAMILMTGLSIYLLILKTRVQKNYPAGKKQ